MLGGEPVSVTGTNAVLGGREVIIQLVGTVKEEYAFLVRRTKLMLRE